MADDPHARQRREWRKAIADLRRQQRIARQKWQRAAPQPGAGMNRRMPEAEEGTMTGDSVASDLNQLAS